MVTANTHPRPRKHLLETVTINVVGGGGLFGAIPVLAADRDAINLYVDNANEIRRHYDLLKSLGVTTVAVGQQETTATLFATKGNGSGSIPGGNMVCYQGMGATAVIGSLASGKFQRSANYAALLQEIKDGLVTRAGQLPALIYLRYWASIVGGTGTGLIDGFAFQMARDLADLSIPVNMELNLLGAIFVAGASKRAQFNAGANIPVVVAMAIDCHKKSPLVTCRVEFTEHAPLQGNIALRHELAALDVQALQSPGLRADREITFPNAATERTTGIFSLREANWVAFADRATEIRAAVAALLHPQFKAISEGSANALGEFVNDLWTPTAQPLPREELCDLVGQADQIDFESFHQAVNAPASRLRFHLVFEMRDGSRLDVRELESQFAESPASFTEASERIGLLEALVQLFDSIEQEIDKALRAIENEKAHSEVALEKAYRSVGQFSLLYSHRRRRKRLVDAARRDRALADEHREFSAKREEALLLQPIVDRERAKLHAQLRDVEQMLDGYLPRHMEIQPADFVELVDSDHCFQTVFNLPSRPETWHTAGLCSLVARTTMLGLATILESRYADAEHIARAIVERKSQFTGPAFGGGAPQGDPAEMVVLPMIADDNFEKLRMAITRLRDHWRVYRSPSMAHGVGVMRYQTRTVADQNELLTGYVRDNLRKAHRHPLRESLCLDFEASCQRLGIVFGDDVVIPTQPPASTSAQASLQEPSPRTENAPLPTPSRMPTSDAPEDPKPTRGKTPRG